MGRHVILNSLSLKVERENAKAMIEGYQKGGEFHNVTIFSAHNNSWSLRNDFRNTPKLITAKRSNPRKEYPLSLLGKNLKANKYKPKNKYVAELTNIFHINNDINMWKTICNSGAFDIWAPEAPFNSLINKYDPMILAFRIYEIDREVTVDDGQYSDRITNTDEVELIRPVIQNNDYRNLINQLLSSIGNNLKRGGHERI